MNVFIRKLYWQMLSWGPRRRRVVASWNGSLTIASDDVGVGRWLFVYREFERDLIERVLRILRERGRDDKARDFVLDVGANVGVIGLALLRHRAYRRAILVEPEPRNLTLLRENVVRNGFDDVSVILPCALTNHDGDVEMELAAGNLGDHRIRGKRSIPTGMREYYGEGRRRLIVVKTRTLDSVAARELKGTAERIGLAWVDIQGQEGAFLEGARQTLDRHRFPVMMELWPYGLRRSGMTRDRFCALVREHFSEIVLLGDGGPDEQHDAADLDVLFDRFPYPSHGNVLLVP